jgi:hypothetical protein
MEDALSETNCKRGETFMAKRDRATKRTKTGGASTRPTKTSNTPATTAMEERVLAFAEQLGYMAGAIQAKSEGWMDRETLDKQIAGVRDGAAHLLEQLKASTIGSSKTAPAGAARQRNAGRSGGAVDAPGKKHRKPAPADPRATRGTGQTPTMRIARTRHQARG